MEKHGRELTCKGVYDILDELKNVCLNEEDSFGYASLMVEAYNNIKNTSPIGDNDDEGKYPDLVILGDEDGDTPYIDEHGLLVEGSYDEWTVIEIKRSCELYPSNMEMLFGDEYRWLGHHNKYIVYDTPTGERYITVED